MKRLFTSFLLIGAFSANAQTVHTIVLRPGPTEGFDASITKQGNTGYATDVNLIANAWTVGGGELTMRSLFKFPIPVLPAGANFVNATLTLYGNTTTTHPQGHSSYPGAGYGTTNESWLKRLTSPWTPTTVNWNNQPSTGSLMMSLQPSNAKHQDFVINVTGMVKEMLDSPATSFGFSLSLQNDSAYRSLIFGSSDHLDSNKRPKLVITYTMPITSAVQNVNANEAIRIFPNPASQVLHVTFANNKTEKVSLVLTDALGKVALQKSESVAPNGEIALSVADLPRGIYFVRINFGGAVINRRISVE